MQNLLIDENLSPSLVGPAIAKGFVGAHVNHLGLIGLKDWELKASILDGDWTFITNNRVDFRGPANGPEAMAFTPASRCTLDPSASMHQVG